MAASDLDERIGGLRISTQIKQDTKKLFRDLGIQEGSTIMAPKPLDAHRDGISLSTNVYGVLMSKNVIVYRYEVAVNGLIRSRDGDFRTVDLTKAQTKDALIVDRRNNLRDIFLALQNQTGGYFAGTNCVYYDLTSILYSLDQLKPVGEASEGVIAKLIVMNTELPDGVAYDFERYEFTIRTVQEGSAFLLGDLSGLSNDLAHVERSLAQFLDISTSQYPMFASHEHVTFSTADSYLMEMFYGFQESDGATFEETNSYLAIGSNKGVRFIEGPKENGQTASVVIQTKKTPFHRFDLLKNTARLLVLNLRNIREDDRAKLEKFLKGLVVRTIHGTNERVTIRGISKETAATRRINVDGEEITVETYFNNKYSARFGNLTEPLYPLVIASGRDNCERFFPIEVCEIMDNQRVNKNQLTPRMTQQIIRKCAIPPTVLKTQNEQTAASLRLWDAGNNGLNRWLSAADIKVVDRPANVKAHILSPPEIQTRSLLPSRVHDNIFTWQCRDFIVPAGNLAWAAYAFLDRDRLSLQEYEIFLNRLVSEAQSRGMGLGGWADASILGCSQGIIDSTFAEARNHECKFIFVVHQDVGEAGDIAHTSVKYAERNSGIITQCIKLATLRNVMQKNQVLTLSNIVNKTNMKLGGLNYSLSTRNSQMTKDLLELNTLYIGIGVNHPGGGLGMRSGDEHSKSSSPEHKSNIKEFPNVEDIQSKLRKDIQPPPSVIGFSANIGYNGSFDFVGDFMYQEVLRNEPLDVIMPIIKRCVTTYIEKRKRSPEFVVLYRNGCDEGSFKAVLKYEVPMIKYALKNLQCESKLTVIVVNKMQNIRFFKTNANSTGKAPDQNLKCGTVVDHTIVHPKYCEFFLNSHRALQGTARTPKYTVLIDECKLSLTELESMTYQLCYGHQIVFMPTSVPSPVYIADEYAKRGRTLYQKWMDHEGTRQDSYELLTGNLCFYTERNLFGKRVNA